MENNQTEDRTEKTVKEEIFSIFENYVKLDMKKMGGTYFQESYQSRARNIESPSEFILSNPYPHLDEIHNNDNDGLDDSFRGYVENEINYLERDEEVLSMIEEIRVLREIDEDDFSENEVFEELREEFMNNVHDYLENPYHYEIQIDGSCVVQAEITSIELDTDKIIDIASYCNQLRIGRLNLIEAYKTTIDNLFSEEKSFEMAESFGIVGDIVSAAVDNGHVFNDGEASDEEQFKELSPTAEDFKEAIQRNFDLQYFSRKFLFENSFEPVIDIQKWIEYATENNESSVTVGIEEPMDFANYEYTSRPIAYGEKPGFLTLKKGSTLKLVNGSYYEDSVGGTLLAPLAISESDINIGEISNSNDDALSLPIIADPLSRIHCMIHTNSDELIGVANAWEHFAAKHMIEEFSQKENLHEYVKDSLSETKGKLKSFTEDEIKNGWIESAVALFSTSNFDDGCAVAVKRFAAIPVPAEIDETTKMNLIAMARKNLFSVESINAISHSFGIEDRKVWSANPVLNLYQIQDRFKNTGLKFGLTHKNAMDQLRSISDVYHQYADESTAMKAEISSFIEDTSGSAPLATPLIMMPESAIFIEPYLQMIRECTTPQAMKIKIQQAATTIVNDFKPDDSVPGSIPFLKSLTVEEGQLVISHFESQNLKSSKVEDAKSNVKNIILSSRAKSVTDDILNELIPSNRPSI